MNIVYAIECLIDGKSYVGVSYSLDSRWKAHVLSSRPSNRKNKWTPLDIAIATHGPSAFTQRVLTTCESRREAHLYERLFTHLLESNDPLYGYNDPRLYRSQS